ncbi:MAG: protein translocase subunit SecD [Candidatus Nanopelagicales bacterium]
MAAPTRSRPGRALLVLALVTVALSVWAFWPGTDHTPRLGLDLRGGTQVILVPKPVKEGETISDQQLTQTVEIIRQRVNGIGVAEAEVAVQGSGNNAAIVVSVPGVNQERIVELVGRTALLDFRPVEAISAPGPVTDTPTDAATPSAEPTGSPSPSPSASAAPEASASAEASPAASPSPSATNDAAQQAGNQLVQAQENTPEFQAEVAALDCLDPQNRAGGTPDDPDLWLGTCDRDGAGKYTLQPAFIRGTQVTDASAQLAQGGVGWVVTLNFDSEGASALAEASTQLYQLPPPQNQFAIVLDGVVYSAPSFREPIIGGSAQIEGSFTSQEAQDLANVLKFGALPVTLDVAEVTSVSPTLGTDQLRAGLLAGALGLALVVLYLLFYYRALGIVAALSLAVAGYLTYVSIVVLGKAIGFTLTLAGVAGVIVAIGITADSFVVYFERLRDEIREGKSLRQATEAGWIRARRTLLAADFVSLLAAVVLYWLSVGSVRGFAFALGLTTIIDVAVAFWFTHPVVVLLGNTRWMQKGGRWSGVDPHRLGATTLAGTSATTRRRRTPAGVGARDGDGGDTDTPGKEVE